jgi:hypothetical protein
MNQHLSWLPGTYERGIFDRYDGDQTHPCTKRWAANVHELGWEVTDALEESRDGFNSSGYEASAYGPYQQYLSIGGLANLQFAQVHAQIEARWADDVTFHTDLPVSEEDAHQEAYEAYLAEQEYSDSQRLDEMLTADDSNRFEEEQVSRDNDLERSYDDADVDPDDPWLT